MEGVYKGLGYKTELEKQSLLVKHDVKPNMVIELKASNRFIGVIGFGPSKGPGILQKSGFLEAINKANTQSFVVNFSWAPGSTAITTSTFMWLASKVSARDIADFTDVFAEQITHLFTASGLRTYA